MRGLTDNGGGCVLRRADWGVQSYMVRLIITVITLAFSASALGKELKWRVGEIDRQENAVYIGCSMEGGSNFVESVQSVPKDTKIKHIFFCLHQLDETNLQSELHSYFKDNHPEELESALSSAGNMHNPKVRPLAGVFQKAMLATDYVAQLNEALMEKGYEITEFSFEKFYIVKHEEMSKFDAIVWLVVKKYSQQLSD